MMMEDKGDRALPDGTGPREPSPSVSAVSASVPNAETLESIISWGDQTFGPCSQDRAIERAGEEWSEMEEVGADVPIEAADVIICLLRIPGILDAINRKMAINRGRTWDIRSDGTGYHVKPPKCDCGQPATTKYDGDEMCEPCARYCAQRDFEEDDMPGGFA